MKVRWSKSAERDLDAILAYVSDDSIDAALRIRSVVRERAGGLAAFPSMGRVGRLPGTRELILSPSPYFIVYRITDQVVQIMRIMHGAQRWP